MAEMGWNPPGKNCGLCGVGSCDEFVISVQKGEKSYFDCPFYREEIEKIEETELCRDKDSYSGKDILGRDYDFILDPMPCEVSARKVILPFRPDLVEKWEIVPDDIVVGRPAGSGCPVQHVMRVIDANAVTGVLTCFVVGPAHSRGKQVKEIEAYHVVGFVGVARVVAREPVFGMRQRFLPGFCMMDLSHTGVINMILEKKDGFHVRIEDIRL